MFVETIKGAEAKAVLRALSKGKLPFLFSGGRGPSQSNFSYAGVNPFLVIRTLAGETSAEGLPEFHGRRWGDPFQALGEVSTRFMREIGPFPFSGGAVGYLSYDLSRLFLPTHSKRPRMELKGPDIPDSIIGIYNTIVVVDHEKDETSVVSTDSAKAASELANTLATALREGSNRPKAPAGRKSSDSSKQLPDSNMTREEYIERVVKAKDYIREGDIYQINITQQLKIPFSGDPFSLYERIFKRNPAPFSSFMDFGRFQVISNSPERLLSVKGKEAVTEPIKGTRPRGADSSEDEEKKRELFKSKKERAEHVMIVDLERNDLGRVSKAGTVQVADFERIETYKFLHHMVSTVKGTLRDDIDAPRALKEIFPGGSITGTPKLRATEIIAELENIDRGLYTGAIGWMDFSGSMDMAVAIRTAVLKNHTLHLGVGSGIVADSDPGAEYDESLLKAEDFISAAREGV